MKNSDKYKMRVMVTGGAGFIGSNLLLHLVSHYPDYLFVNVDDLTYAGNPANLSSIESSQNYCFEKINICDYKPLSACFNIYNINAVIHLAAETHVDRSILEPAEFIQTNITGTFNLLECSRTASEACDKFRFHFISTDEIYGSRLSGSFDELSPFSPNSPYAASKAAGNHLVRSYHKTYGLETVISISSNNYGPFQFPEKLIPLIISNAKQGKELPVYGDGQQVRDWLHVSDHCQAIDLVFHQGQNGHSYNISSSDESTNLALVKQICQLLEDFNEAVDCEKLIKFVTDRPGHDQRYSLDSSKIRTELNWKPQYSLETGLRETIKWYLDNSEWLKNCSNGDYLKYYDNNYSNR